MKTLSLFLVALMFALRGVFAQRALDIVWGTNAHSAVVSDVKFSADGTRVCSGSPDYYWKVWMVSEGELLQAVFSLNESIASIALSSDGSFLATGDDEGKTRMWRVSDGARLWSGGPDNRFVYSVCFSPDDSLIAIGRSDGINVGYAASGVGIPFGEPEDSKVFGVCFSPDGMALASANENQNASLFSVPGGILFRDFIGHSNEVRSVDFSPDGKLLATASADGTARIWNVTNGVALQVMEGGGGVAKFSADGKFLFTLSDGTFKIWRVATGQYVGSLTNTGALCFDIAKNGKYFAYGRGDGALVLARMPVVINSITRLGHEVTLEWQGGSGLYQLQARTNFASDSWQNVGGSTTNTSATNVSSATTFFRVQSLPIP